jgi:transposase-like protein
MASVLSAKHFHDEKTAYAFVEARVWPNGRVCPHCGTIDRSAALKGASTRIGTYKCYDCRKPFTVKVGTVFEASNIKLHIWLQAMHLMCSSKKGISSNQLHRVLGVSLKTAWFMSHRIRAAMASGDLSPFGAGGGVVEADETFLGTDPDRDTSQMKHGKKGPLRRWPHMNKVLSLVDRSTGQARSFVVDQVNAATLAPILTANIAREAHLMTDESKAYTKLGREFAAHGFTRHGQGEYVRYDPSVVVHTNTIEGYFSIFKRGMKGVYQHCDKKHLHRYMAEFDFRYSNRIKLGVDDLERTSRAISGIVGKRLMYRDSLAAAV